MPFPFHVLFHYHFFPLHNYYLVFEFRWKVACEFVFVAVAPCEGVFMGVTSVMQTTSSLLLIGVSTISTLVQVKIRISL
jgi:hypothetical protein